MSTTTNRPQQYSTLREIREMVPWEEGQIRLGALLIECPEWLAGLPSLTVLCCAPFVGERIAHALLIRANVFDDYQPVGDLSARQRRVLACSLGYNEGPLA